MKVILICQLAGIQETDEGYVGLVGCKFSNEPTFWGCYTLSPNQLDEHIVAILTAACQTLAWHWVWRH